MVRMIALLFLFAVGTALAAQDSYDRSFTPAAMRVDLYHTGTRGEEIVSLDRIYQEGDWPGSRVNLIDTLNLGEYIARVYDSARTQLLFSRGYSSIFDEWQTTNEALAGIRRTFSVSVRMPFPRQAVRLVISRRDKQMAFHEIFSAVIDPAVPAAVDRRPLSRRFPLRALMQNGPSATKVDILILGDGYTKEEMEKFRSDARRMTQVLFSTPPFSRRKKDFNVWTLEVESPRSGIDVPDRNVWKGSTLGCSYSAFGLPRYVLTEANRALREIAAEAPYDFVCILVNDTRYGGGGIFNLYSTTYTKELVRGQEWQSDYMFVHEFGHSFAGLADEYYTSATAYNDLYTPGIEPWEPNVAALKDRANIRWKAFLTPGVPIPTPWEKSGYDSLAAIVRKFDRLAPDYYRKREPYQRAENAILSDPRFAGVVGAFEGAGYASKGLYRPSLDCRMFSLSLVPFDPVCSAAIERMIDFCAR